MGGIIYSGAGMRLVVNNDEDNIYPNGIIRITATKQFVKISCSHGFSVALARDAGSRTGYLEEIEGLVLMGGEYMIKATAQMKILMEEIAERIKEKDEHQDHMILELRVTELLLLISRHDKAEGKRLPVSEDCAPSQARTARSVYSYMMRHMDEHVTIEGLAEKFAMSRTQIKESFKKYYGESVYGYMRREKMLVAADLLEKTDYPIASISKQCGYVNSSKFARAFSTIMEVTPSKYRSHGRT